MGGGGGGAGGGSDKMMESLGYIFENAPGLN